MEQQENPLLELYEWLESGIVTVVGMLLLFTLIVRPATVNGPSMMKTLHDGDRLILQQAGYHDPQYGDIVVIDRTGTGEPEIVKRVIGRAGDTIDIDFTHLGRLAACPEYWEGVLAWKNWNRPQTSRWRRCHRSSGFLGI